MADILMYLPRVNANIRIKSESLKPRENTIKEKPMKVVRNMLVMRQQTHEIGWVLESRDSK